MPPRPILVLVLLHSLTSVPAQGLPPQPVERLYVANRGQADVTVIDIPQHTRRSIPVGRRPDGIAASRAGDRLYVSIGNAEIGYHLVAVDTRTEEILWRTPIGRTPHQLGVSPEGSRVYAALFEEHALEVIDTAKRAVVGRVRVGYGPHNLLLSADGNTIYVAALLGDEMSIVDARELKLARSIALRGKVRPFDLTADGRRLYVQLSWLHGFVTVDLEQDRIVGRVDMGPLKELDANLPFPFTVCHGIALTPNNRQVVSASTLGNFAGIYTVPEHRERARVPVGSSPRWVAFGAGGALCYVSNSGSDDVSVISMKEARETARIPVGHEPHRIITVRPNFE